MNTRRILFWTIFVVVLGLIIWGLSVAIKNPAPANNFGAPGPLTAADHIEGPVDAKVTLMEYGDFECPACAAYASMVERLASEEATGTLRVVFRHFPLPQHANAMISAQASEAAAMQGKFWDMYKLLYAGQDVWANLSDAGARDVFDGYASTLGLDKAKFDSDIDSSAVKQIIEADLSESQSMGLNYTPTFFVNGQAIQNPPSYEAFKAIIEAAAR